MLENCEISLYLQLDLDAKTNHFSLAVLFFDEKPAD